MTRPYPDLDQQVFTENRNLLFSVAYRVLGTATDAEDAVQDAWIKWSAADRPQVADPKAYLTRIVSNLAMDRLRSTRYKRETYVGPWLPEPILTSGDTADAITNTESVSMAMLVVLETLSPLERAVFVLKEVFDFSHAEIAQAVERSEAAVRQAAHRAREHVQARRPRFTADRSRQREVTERFFAAATGGDISTSAWRRRTSQLRCRTPTTESSPSTAASMRAAGSCSLNSADASTAAAVRDHGWSSRLRRRV
ncbi:hypothetical protein GCM10022226_83050 [Sphaerisporangium flaviroseum]|uniref:RNA polymerase subunit sigma-24 n=1 Tax=Sphaerisporangium flaviroseum TaxID=509199 RepID=A0ABP7JK14_9ACTN